MPVIRKIAGFRNAMMTMLGREDVEDLIQRTMFTVEGGAAAASRLIDKGATAIVCGSDLMALGAIRAARQRGLEVPRDLSVVGYDDSTLIAFTDPPLTTVRQSVQAMGEAAVRALIDEISGEPAPRAEYVFRPELVVRSSTGAVPHAAPAYGVVRLRPRCRRAARLAPQPGAARPRPARRTLYGHQAV